VSQPYPGPGQPYPAPPYQGPPHPGPPYYPAGYPVAPAIPQYRPLRRTALVAIVLMVLTALATAVQAVLMWRSYDEVKRFVYGLLSEDEIDSGVQSVAGAGPVLDLVFFLVVGAGIAFLIWLWQARDNTEVLKPSPAVAYQAGQRLGSGLHRLTQGWVVGSWICPIVQFWYPLQVVEDVVRASEPPAQPGTVNSSRYRGLLYSWWGAWTTFWVIAVGGGGVAMVSFFVWIVRLVDRTDAADATGDYVDIYDLQDFMVRVALAVNIGFTVAAVLLIAAAVAIAFLMLRVTRWQDVQPSTGGPAQPPTGPPQYAPRPNQPSHPQDARRAFPSYARPPGNSSH
jgi:hypothetical protein